MPRYIIREVLDREPPTIVEFRLIDTTPNTGENDLITTTSVDDYGSIKNARMSIENTCSYYNRMDRSEKRRDRKRKRLAGV